MLLGVLLTFGGVAGAQSTRVELELGYRNSLVDGAWNPLRLLTRDLPAATLEVRIDQGSLRSGSVPLEYSARLDASRGVTVFEDDLFIPPWRSLTWVLRGNDAVLASGSFDPRGRDDRPLTLLLSDRPGRWLEALPQDSRPQEVAAARLSVRPAAYSGVDALIIDGSSAAPSQEAVVTAAAAGVVVLLVGPLPASHSHLQRLLGGDSARIGAGWLVSAAEEDVASLLQSLPRLEQGELAATIARSGESGRSAVPPRLTVLLVAAGYAVAVLLLVRLGSAGVVTALVVGALVTVSGWWLLRPPEPLLQEARTIVIGSGGLALAVPTLAVRSLPGGAVEFESPMRLLRSYPYSLTPAGTRVSMERWQRETLLGKPRLVTPTLAWDGDVLVNSGDDRLVELFVLGMGPQPPLPADGRLRPRSGPEGAPAGTFAQLAPSLPAGTALALSGDRVYLALPPAGAGS